MFIVLYGINNIGKTTQAKLLSQKLSNTRFKSEYIKYPIYDLTPTGPILNNYLRRGNSYKLNAKENQLINTINKTQFEPKLKKKLDLDVVVVAEDYVGTSVAWGVSNGISIDFLEEINSHLIKEDLSILLHGDRFKRAIERDNKHENNEKLIKKTQENFLALAKENQWNIVDANESIEEVHKKIYEIVKKCL